MISKFFIERPVLANVIAILMVVIGLVALINLPVSQYPDITPPTVQVTTRYPGASARTVIDTVALPIEQQVNGVEDMIYMQSYSTDDGSYTLTVTFKIGTDLNFAQVLVQNRVATALAALPQAVQVQGVNTQKKSTAILQIIALTSPNGSYDSLYLANYATIRLKDELSRLPGVGNVNVFGAGQYSMRIWLDPEKLQARGLQPSDVVNSLQQQSQQVTAGQIGAPPAPAGQSFQYTLNIYGRLDDAEEFANVIVKTGSAGDITRVSDVGRVELGAQTYGQVFTLDGRPSAGLAIFQSPGANALNVGNEVGKRMRELSREFPQDLTYGIPFDTTKFVRASVNEVYKTLFEAGILVLIVILFFLQDWRATLVPATTVPVTIIGAFAAHGGDGLHRQHVDAVRAGAGDRHRRRRRHRRGRRRRPQYRAGHVRARRRDPRDGSAVRTDHRHHAGADGGVHPGRVPAGPDRPHVCAVRAGHRRDRAAQRRQCGDAQAHAMRDVAASNGAARKAQHRLSRLRPCLPAVPSATTSR